jgi:hypothetical protein
MISIDTRRSSGLSFDMLADRRVLLGDQKIMENFTTTFATGIALAVFLFSVVHSKADDSFTENSWDSGTITTPLRDDQTRMLYNPPAEAYYPPVQAYEANRQFNQTPQGFYQ